MSLVTDEQENLTTSRGQGGDLAILHQSLAQFCRAGLPLPKACRLLAEDLRRGRLKNALQRMGDQIDQGLPLAEAYRNEATSFPPIYGSLLEVGKTTDDLPGVLDEISRHAAVREGIRSRLRSALAYPLVTSLFVLAIGTWLFFFFFPALNQLPIRNNSGTAIITKAALIGMGAIILGALTFLWAGNPTGWGTRLFRRLPFIRSIYRLAIKASFTATLSLLIRRHIPLPLVLSLARETMDDKPEKQMIGQMEAASHKGAGLAQAIGSTNMLEPSLVGILEAGEKTGDLSGTLDSLTTIYQDRFERAMNSAIILVRPIAEIVIGIVVFLCLLGAMRPMMLKGFLF